MPQNVLRIAFLLNNWSVLEHDRDAFDRDICVLLKECSFCRCTFGLVRVLFNPHIFNLLSRCSIHY